MKVRAYVPVLEADGESHRGDAASEDLELDWADLELRPGATGTVVIKFPLGCEQVTVSVAELEAALLAISHGDE